MDFLYFLVTSLEQYVDKYGFHSSYFSTNGAFGEGALYAAIIGAAVALVFYFVLCNGSSVKPATRVNWLVGLTVVALAAFFVGDMMIIGSDGTPGTGFYAHCQQFANDFMIQNQGNTQAITDCQTELNTILTNLRQGNDVALMFNITSAAISALVYFLVSLGVKNLTKFGSQIPF